MYRDALALAMMLYEPRDRLRTYRVLHHVWPAMGVIGRSGSPSVQTTCGIQFLGVSRERVYQLTSLVTNLPPEIRDFLAGAQDPAVLRFLAERRLRPLTMIPDGETQMAQFAELLATVRGGASGSQ